MHERGTTTEDLRSVRSPAPANPADLEEKATRRFGRRNYITGISIIVGTVLSCLIFRILGGSHMYDSPTAQLFGTLGILSSLLLGTTLALAGAAERKHRPERAATRDILVAADRNRIRIEQLTQDTDERLQVVMGLLAPVPGRLDLNSERLARIEQALTVLADRLPKELLAEHWRGFNEAVKEGFSQQRTGTDGQLRRPPHLGLVAPKDPDRPR